MEAADAAMEPARRPAGLEPRSVHVAVAAVGRMNDGDADCLLIFEGDEARCPEGLPSIPRAFASVED